jgi:hypothetical protein
MKNTIKFLTLLGLLVATNIQAQNMKTVAGFGHIESLATDGKFLYAADIGQKLDPAARDGDGKIVKLDKKGNILQVSLFAEKLNAPKGIAINKGVLYLTDIDRLVAFDLKTSGKLFEIDLSKDTAFLNDIAVWDNNTLYVSATDKSKLYKVNLTAKSYEEVTTDKTILGINGLFCYKNANRIYVNGIGASEKANGVVGYINLKDNTFHKVTQIEGMYDGIFISNDVLYVSNWVAFEKKGIIQGIGIYGSNRVRTINAHEPIAGPADFTILDGVLFVPAMISGEIHIIDLDRNLYLKL